MADGLAEAVYRYDGKELVGVCKAVLMAIALKADDKDCLVSIDRAMEASAKDTGLSDVAIGYALTFLKKEKFLVPRGKNLLGETKYKLKEKRLMH